MKLEAMRGNDIRELNEKLVLHIIHQSGGISQSEVTARTGLKPPTVFRIFSHLEENGYISICRIQKNASEKKGRRPVFYCVKPEAFYVIGIDFWAVSASIVLLDFTGNPVFRREKEFPRGSGSGEVLGILLGLIGESLSESGIDIAKILGIGIGAPGKVNIGTGTVLYYSRIADMENFALKEPIESRFGIPVHVHNNAAVVALSEYRYGIARGAESLLTVLVRSGVGGSFLSEKKVMVTNDTTTLEVGHMSVDLDGADCECGGSGCLEAYVSEDSILEEIRKVAPVRRIEDLDTLIPGDLSGPRGGAIVSSLQEKGRILAVGIRTLYHLFGPGSFLIVTRSERLSALLADMVGKTLEEDRHLCRMSQINILSAKYDPLRAGAGAADLVFDHFFA